MRANLPTVDEQIEMMVEAEDMRNESAPISSASPSLGGGYSQEDIDSILTKGSGFQDSKYRIYRQFLKAADSKSNIDFLKREYGTGSGSYHFSDGRSGHFESGGKGFSIDRELILTWSKAEKRLRELIQNNRYFSPKEKDHYADYLEGVSARSMKSTARGKRQGSVSLMPTVTCSLPTNVTRSPSGSPTSSVTWTAMKKICLKTWGVPTLAA